MAPLPFAPVKEAVRAQPHLGTGELTRHSLYCYSRESYSFIGSIATLHSATERQNAGGLGGPLCPLALQVRVLRPQGKHSGISPLEMLSLSPAASV